MEKKYTTEGWAKILIERQLLFSQGKRKCNNCNDIKELKDFYKRNDQEDGHSVQCSECLRKSKRQERYKNYFNIDGSSFTHEDLLRVFENQFCKCDICNRSLDLNKRDKSWCVDHDHKTMIVRGILCSKCNRGIGLFDESTNSLNNAIQYLSKFNKLM